MSLTFLKRIFRTPQFPLELTLQIFIAQNNIFLAIGFGKLFKNLRLLSQLNLGNGG